MSVPSIAATPAVGPEGETPARGHPLPETAKVAVLIDGENIGSRHMAAVVRELGDLWEASTVRRVYANWHKGEKAWQEAARTYALREMQQLEARTHKNATDIAIVIDAMELAAQGVGTIVVVSSDGDYLPLAIRMREEGVRFIGVGNSLTTNAYRKACSDFIRFDRESSKEALLDEPVEYVPVPDAASSELPEHVNSYEDLALILEVVNRHFHDREGFTPSNELARYAEVLGTTWRPKKTHNTDLKSILEMFPSRFETVAGPFTGVRYRCRTA